jgi:two-component system LytT family sensor kinase
LDRATTERIGEEERLRVASRRRATLILILAFWAFAVAMLSIRAMLIDTAPLSVLGPRRLATALMGTFLCLGMARLLEMLRNRSFPERIVWGLVGAVAMAVALTVFTSLLNQVVFPVPELGEIDLVQRAQWALAWLGYFLAWTGTHLALTYHWESQEHQRRADLLARTTREAQMAALRYQLSPHFLFNTLNSISSLVGEERNADAETMLLNLATFVRSTLSEEAEGTVSLRQEIELQRLYLAIEQARFGERLQVEIDLPFQLTGVRVPALILQPLVENAVHHGVARCEDRLTLRIAAEDRGDRVALIVEDDGKAGAAAAHGKARGPGHGQGLGLGLANVRARLHAHFDGAGLLIAGARAEGGYRVELVFPRTAG